MKTILAFLKRALLHNIGLKIASLLLAFVVWFIVVLVGDPQDTRPYNNIPVRLVNTDLLEEQGKVYEILDRTDVVRVMVTAPTSVFQSLRSSDIIAEADVSKLTDINTIAITYYALNTGAERVSFEGDHEVVRLNVEDRDSKWIRVAYQTTGNVAEGYIVGNTSVDQTLINISGAKSYVSQVTSATVELNVEGATNNISANVDIVLRDADGNRLSASRVEMSAEHLLMTAEVLATKEVPIEANIMGEPAEGYMMVGERELSQESVLIAGTLANLANVSKITIPPEKLDVTGLTEDKSFMINLKDCLPGNIRLAESDFNGKISVDVTVGQIRERNLEVPAENITFLNLPEGFTVSVVQDEEGQTAPIPITVSGLRENVNGLRASAIPGAVDIIEWMRTQGISALLPGIYEVPTSFEVGEFMTVTESGTVRIEITRNGVAEE